MKRLLSVLLFCALLLAACATAPREQTTQSSPAESTPAESTPAQDRESPPVLSLGAEDFTCRYVRTDGYHSGATYPVVTVVRSKAALNDYYEQYKERYAFAYGSFGINPSDIFGEYDDAFFESNGLVLILLEEGSGSIHHRVTDVEDGVITVERLFPEMGTCDMAEWHILIELPKEVAADSYTVNFITVHTYED